MDVYMVAYVEITSAYLLTGQNQRWTNFSPISAIFAAPFQPFW
jgi:hypothetical protein